ncbi:MAG: hypothetical protein J6M46_09280, partial [Lachnospiraceae bacterium]|nr:hypothetical protein [Lachnospiraceae bacterium]
MKKLAWQSALLVLSAVLICVICRLYSNTYTAIIPVTIPADQPVPLSMHAEERDEPDTGTLYFDEPKMADGHIRVQMKPGQRGEVWSQLKDGSGQPLSYGSYHVGAFGTIYDYSTGGFT